VAVWSLSLQSGSEGPTLIRWPASTSATSVYIWTCPPSFAAHGCCQRCCQPCSQGRFVRLCFTLRYLP